MSVLSLDEVDVASTLASEAMAPPRGVSPTPDLPTINERLAYLRPSRELLEYYRKKIGEFDAEHDDMVQRLEQYRLTYEEQHRVQWEVRQREEEISELQKALSDMQVYLFQEREQVLRLYAENDRLKLQELQDRKKIHHLLQLSGLTEREVSYFMKEPPAKPVVEQRLPTKLQHLRKQRTLGKGTTAATPLTEEEQQYNQDVDQLRLQVGALQAQLEEQTRLSREEVQALSEDRRLKTEEYETRRQRDADKIQTITQKLHKTQDLLYDSTKDLLELRYSHRAHERVWMGEKDKLLQQLDACRQQLNLSRDDPVLTGGDGLDSQAADKEEIQALGQQLKQAQKLADMYREQVIQLEDELARIREEGEVGKELFKERSEKVAKRLELMNQRYQDLERRRNLEVEGFRTDIKQLRQRLKQLEKQLYKVTIGFSEDVKEVRPEDLDMHILKQVRRTAGHSQQLTNELKTLKAKVYGMENDLRHL